MNVRAAETRSLDPVESSLRSSSERSQWGVALRAAATASSRELTPRARKRRRMWFLTVSVLRWSSAAICFVERPCSSRRSTSTWRGVRCGCGAMGVSSRAFLQEPEDADHLFAVLERHRADLHRHPLPGGRKQDAGCVCGRGGAEHLPREQLAGAPAVLGRDDGGDVATANVAEQPLGCRIDPTNDPRCVEDVARDADALQSLLDVPADSQAGDHDEEYGLAGSRCRRPAADEKRRRRSRPASVPCGEGHR